MLKCQRDYNMKCTMKNKKFIIIIQVDDEGSSYTAKGNMTSGNVKMMVGELELIKARLLNDLEMSLDNNTPTQRFEFD